MDWKKIAVFVVLGSLVAQVVHIVESALTMGYYADPAYFGVWSKVMMPSAGAPPLSFFAWSVLFTLIGMAIFALSYRTLGGALKQTGLKKGAVFGAWVFLIAQVPFTTTLFLLVNLPVALLAAWTFSALVVDLAVGVLAAKLL